MLGKQNVIAFLACTDVIKAKEFYGETLGLDFCAEDDFAIVYALPGVELRIQKVPEFMPQPHTVFGWSVNSIVETVDGLTHRGIEFIRYNGLQQDDMGIWRSLSGAKIAWFKDPDGNVLSLTEHA